MCRNLAVKGVKADGRGGTASHAFAKRQKKRLERRRAKGDPECPAGYGRFRGWET